MPHVRQPTPAGRVARARRDEEVARELALDGLDWAAVVAFYAAYHRVRAAFAADPLFTDERRCIEKHPLLRPRHRDSSKHGGRTQPYREWGVNELVELLYPHIGAEYLELHMASVQVRYGRELSVSLDRVLALEEIIRDASESGSLRAT